MLALQSLTIDPDARKRLDRLHDPFTRDLALAVAYEDLGDTARGNALRADLLKRFPEWKRPASR